MVAGEASPAEVWIDARRPASGRRLWGMNLVERQVRELARLGARRFCVWVEATTRSQVERLRADLPRLYAVQVEFREGDMDLALGRAQAPLVLLEGDALYDERILAHLLQQGPGAAVKGDAAAFYLSAEQARLLGGGQGAEALVLKRFAPADLDPYVPSLRLVMEPYLLRVGPQQDLRPLERLMYRRTFKGVLDAVALYGYYDLVRWLTRHLSRTGLTPNLFTVLSIACVWGAVPLFALGHLGWGVAVAWVGVILDSVDGKLARLRLHLSEAMGALEHIAAMPGLGLWYAALGWHLSGGDLFGATPLALATWTLLAAFVLDKMLSGSFKALFGRELFDYRPLDARFHLVAARRNITLLLFSVGILVGRAEGAFVAMAAWTVATLLFHAGRFLWIAATRTRPGFSGRGAGS